MFSRRVITNLQKKDECMKKDLRSYLLIVFAVSALSLVSIRADEEWSGTSVSDVKDEKLTIKSDTELPVGASSYSPISSIKI